MSELDELFETNEPFEKIIPRKGEHGEILGILDIYTFPLHDQETGKSTGAIEYVRDITERKKVEKRLKLNQFAIDKSSIEVFWIMPDAHFLYVNEAACESLGYFNEELLTKTVYDVDPLISPEKWDSLFRDLKEKGSLMFESLHQRKDGSVFPVQITANYLKFDEKEYNITFAIDTTKQKEAFRGAY